MTRSVRTFFPGGRIGRIFAVGVACAVVASPTAGADAGPGADPVTCSSPGWVGAWAAPPGGAQRFIQIDAHHPAIVADSYPLTVPRVIADETLRMIVVPETAGSAVRIHFSNRYGVVPVTFRHAHVGRQSGGAEVVAGSNIPLTFSGADEVTVAPGQDVVSDAAALPVRPFDHLAVSFHVPNAPDPEPTYHWQTNHTSYLSPPFSGDHAAEESAASFGEQTNSVYYVAGVDVYAPAGTAAVAVLGDSFTNSPATTFDTDSRWPDFLSRRLQSTPDGSRLSVVNAALSFNLTGVGHPNLVGPDLVSIGGPAGLYRFETDIAAVPGVRAVILMLGMNDLAFGTSPGDVIAAYRLIIDKAHRSGLKIIGATLTPSADPLFPATMYGLPGVMANRHQVNDFIRNSGQFDAVFDFDAAVADPARPDHWLPGLSPANDNVHPSDLGSQREAESIDLPLLLSLAACH
ncbi:GDSL-type esterase/lipase family protein [Nocardia sp. CDC159]|uniref:GDSL-type esterase/lipase family protein n=1 Tax=Nocardia pulmonis TaxID=2951408 RepID=A0A9X2E9N2_9NOCA|nr:MULTISPECIES: GDSL-type esterase/lipase family protein [Nocardia]MCM6776314.1 GDSL-type esterase/lipase family protein [Nocardia pulmonis]MCM6788738.1 GDSL-type esterase/lipase family protein [Nocardia sp. CDC159]